MQIRRPRGVTVPQLMVVTAVGFLGGVYIWKPLILRFKDENKAQNSETPTTTATPTPTARIPAVTTTSSTKWGSISEFIYVL